MALSKAKLAQVELSLAFIDGLGLSAVKVLVDKSSETPCWLQIESKPSLIEADGARVMFDTVWFPKASHAELVHQQCLDEFGVMPGAAIELPASQVRDAVVNEAGILGARWQSTEDVVEEAENEIRELELQLSALNKSGGMRRLNAKYRHYRMTMIATAQAAKSYSDFLHLFKVRAARLIGQNIAAKSERFSGVAAIIPEIVASMDQDVLGSPKLQNLATPHDDKLNYEPLHHNRKRVHQARRLKA